VETWEAQSWRTAGGANVWSIITADLARGWVFLPVSAAGPDHYGGDRPGANLYATSVVALDVATGRRLWHFQTVYPGPAGAVNWPGGAFDPGAGCCSCR
jgi:quinoprotein glucose dehydrogenase